MTKCILLHIIMLLGLTANAQSLIFINGTISDKSSNEAIPYANIYFKIKQTGTISFNDGHFSINTSSIPDTLIISAVGYETHTIPINEFRNYHLDVQLQPDEIELSEIIIKPGENPANRIMKKVIDAKDQNNPLNIEKIKCRTYTKILVHSSKEGSNSSLPIYFSEKVSENILQRNPRVEKGKVIVERQEGLGFLEQMNILGYSTNLSLGYNFYDNIVEIFDKPFISPLSNRAFLFYKFYLTDSLKTENGLEYTINVVPKNTRDMAFNGQIRIIKDMWSISQIALSIPANANLNYVNNLNIYQEFQPLNDSLNFYRVDAINADLKITKDHSLFDIDFTAHVNKRSVYDSLSTNFEASAFDTTTNSRIATQNSSINTKSVKELRPEPLTNTEQNAIIRIDSLNNDWRIKSADALSQMFITGYIPGEYFELGPYLELIKNNRVEGLRYTLSGRTSSKLTKNTMIYGHIGYGTRDKEWKYGLGIKHKFKTSKRRLISVEYRNDLAKIGDNRSIFLIKENMMVSGEDNLIASIFTNKPLDKISREIKYSATYEHEWRQGVSTTAEYKNRTIYSGLYLPFVAANTFINTIGTNELTLGLRLSWGEKYTDDYCRRYYMGTKYPIVNLRLTGGQYQLGNITNEYLKARLVINHDINIGQTKFEYVLETGATLGDVPFPLLDIHRTDQSLGFARYSFNMMNEMEFASDQFVSLMADYHLNGLLFNRMPFLKQLGIREVASAKLLWSNLGDNHRKLLNYPALIHEANTPYAEISAGIENFFQYFRFDIVWRLNYLNHPNVSPIGIRARFDVNF